MALALAAALAATGSTAARQVPAAQEPVRITVAASGDLLIHSPVWRRALADGGGRRYDFRPMFRSIKPFIEGADLALCHLETPLMAGSPRGYPRFRSPPALSTAVDATGWDACSTASNHSVDYGQRGINSTVAALDRAGVRHAGSYRSARARSRPLILEARGVKVAFLSYTEMTNGIPIPHPWSVNLAEAGRILRDARRARARGARAVIVNLHWGNEFSHKPSAFQRTLARRLVRSGLVTAIVGQHAHVVQPITLTRGKAVVYGEGNLVSNQTSACCPAASQDGLIAFLSLRIDRKGASVERVRYLPTFVRHPDYRVLPARGVSRARTIRVVGSRPGVRPLRPGSAGP